MSSTSITTLGAQFTPVASSSTVYTPISSLKPFQKSLNLRCIVLSKLDISITKDGHQVHSFMVADGSGSIMLNLWDGVGAAIRSADILQVLGGFVTLFKGYIRFACRVGAISRVGSFTMLFKADPNMSLAVWSPDPKNPDNLICKLPSASRGHSGGGLARKRSTEKHADWQAGNGSRTGSPKKGRRRPETDQ